MILKNWFHEQRVTLTQHAIRLTFSLSETKI